jgi:hypothetical protein
MAVGQHGAAVGLLVVVGQADALDPLRTLAGDAHRPGAGAFVPPVAQADVWTYHDPMRLLLHREPAAGGGRFELGGARLRHGNGAPVSMRCQKQRSEVAWSRRERNAEAFRRSIAYGERHRVPWSDILPYRGTASLLNDMLSGQVQVAFQSVPSSIGYVRAGKLRALAVTTATRLDVLPDIPTVGEFVPGYEAVQRYGVGAPRNRADVIEYAQQGDQRGSPTWAALYFPAPPPTSES